MQSKVIEVDELVPLVEEFKSDGKVVVFTNGCFDLLHIGHIRYLQEARDLGDYLVVGINSDKSVKKLKGADRPLVPEKERAEVLAALGCVDFVTVFDDDTPEPLLLKLKPDWHVKGGDYKPSDLPEAKAVASYGGKVKTVVYVSSHSTTALLQRFSK